MVQDIIVYGILLLALSKVVYETVLLVTSKSKSSCGGCIQCNMKKNVIHREN